MRDTWIDEHTGDETVARPDFKAELRAELAKELAAPARRATPWRAIGWASVAAAAAVTGFVVLNGNESERRVVPGATTVPVTTLPGTGTTPDTALPGTTLPGTTQPGTTQPGTTQPGTTLPGAEVPQANWSAGTVLQFPIGFSGVDKVQTGVNPVLGEPTADSGWFTVEPIAPGDEDCLAGIEMRVLHWGDLTIAFRKATTPGGLEGELLWSWVVGDLRGSGFNPSFREPTAAPAGSPSGLRTEDGFGVGTSVDELRSSNEVVLSDFVNSDGSRSGIFVPADAPDSTLFRGLVVDADGTVIGYGATQSFC